MEATETVPALQHFIRERFKIPDDDVDFNEDVHLFDYGYVDSFGAVALTAFVESRFAVTVSESDMVVYPLNTIREIATFIERRRRGEI